MSYRSMVDILNGWAEEQPGALAYRFLLSGEVDGPVAELSYGQLAQRARAVAADLQERGLSGRRALLLYAPGREFVEAFYGCLFGGTVAVPIPIPQFGDVDRGLRRLRHVIGDADIDAVLSTGDLIEGFDAVARDLPELATVPWVATDGVPDAKADAWAEGAPAGRDGVAFLQYTSGSTSNPRGVVVTHDNLMHNERAITLAMAHTRELIETLEGPLIVSWLPVYHDMGLIGPVLNTVYTGASSVLMSPLHFIERPERWLRAISAFGAHSSVSPNFGYELCIRRASRTAIEGLDLSRWNVAFSGAEPVRPSTLRRFADAFGPSGFRPQAFVPGYGLAEATLLVSACPNPQELPVLTHRLPGDDKDSEWVSCGRPADGIHVKIVDPDHLTECAAGDVGEIWVSGDSVAAGYFRDSETTSEVFGGRLVGDQRTYLRTGDLGFLHDGELYVTGRRKDLLIVDGRNHYPQDIELTVEEAHALVRAGCVAAFSVTDEAGAERVVVVAEIKPCEPADRERINDDVRAAVSAEHSLGVHDVVLIPARTIFKTSSGKIQRQACKAAYLAGELQPLADPPSPRPADPAPPATRSGAGVSADDVQAWLVDAVAERLGWPVDRVATDRPLAEFGLGSRTLVELVADLSELVGRQLDLSVVFDHPTIGQLADVLGGPAARPADLGRGADSEPVAIVSMGCRFPGGAEDPEALWDLIANGRDVTGEPVGRDWRVAELVDADPEAVGKTYSVAGGFLSSIDRFDAEFFGIRREEAEAMDPQQRALLEVAWEACERAGVDPRSLRDSATGVYVGAYDSGYHAGVELDQLTGYTGTGSAASVASGRIAYALGLKGPAITVDTACSSSMVAVHLACQALRARECELALAGGVTLMVTPRAHVEFSRLGGLSQSGRCRPFAADADGVLWGEGCGVLVLKRLDDARRDGDTVLAVIRGSATNQDGRSQGLTAPNGGSQEAVIKAALAAAALRPEEIDYVEAHGTGTPLGDPVEAGALQRVFGADRPAGQPLRIGSLKSNIGHTQAAAGVAGIIKAVLAIEHGVLPASLHAEQPSPHLDWERSGLCIQSEQEAWPRSDRVRRVGVSAFGMSGTNAHVVLEEPPLPEQPPAAADAPRLFPLSAASQAALRGQASRLLRRLEDDPAVPLSAVAETLALRRAHLDWRAVVVGDKRSDLLTGLRSIARADENANAVVASAPTLTSGKVAFVFPGQGSQWAGMARDLLATSSEFDAELRRCDDALREYTGWSVRSVLREEPGAPELTSDDVVQPVLFAVMAALAPVWRAAGIEPHGVIGHSQGEVAAAYVAGALTLGDAARIVACRSRSLVTAAIGGVMAVAGLPAEELERRFADHPGDLAIAARNSPRSTVISGDAETVEALLTDLESEQVFVRRLAVQYASHSRHVEPLQGELLAALDGVTADPGRVAWYSTVLGDRLPARKVSSEYWYRNIREPVQFAGGIARMIEDGYRYFVELSPHPSLVTAIQSVAEDLQHEVVAAGSLRRDQPAQDWLDRFLAELYVGGLSPDWRRVGPATGQRADLPTYAWDRQRYWMDPPARARPSSNGLASTDHPILTATVPRPDSEEVVLLGQLSLAAQPWLADHAVGEAILFPAAGFINLALRAGEDAGCDTVHELVLKAPLSIPEEGALSIQVIVEHPDTADQRAVSVYARPADDATADWTLHASGTLAPSPAGETETADGHGWDRAMETAADVAELYESAARQGYKYGPTFRGVQRLCRDGDSIYAEVALADGVAADAAAYRVHPALLDSMLHGLLLTDAPSIGGRIRLPFIWDRVWLRPITSSPVLVRIRARGEYEAQIEVRDARGALVGRVESVRLADATPTQLARFSSRARDSLFVPSWETAAASGDTPPAVEWSEVEPDEAGSSRVSVLRLARSPEPFAPDRATTDLALALERVQSWLNHAADDGVLAIVTSGGVSVREGGPLTDLVHAAVWGMVRCGQFEHPDQLILVDTDRPDDVDEAVSAAIGSGESQVAVRRGQAYVPRLEKVSPADAAVPFDASGTILITGATGSLGSLVARHLASSHGVRSLLLTSRRGHDADGAAELVRDLEERDVEVSLVACDLSDRGSVAAMLESVPADRPLTGVIHAAGALADSAFLSTTSAHIDDAFAAKCLGAWHLHELTAALPVSSFVLFSSFAGLVGSPGQAGYAASNAFLDALAQARRESGLPALSIAWGLWEQQGGMTGDLHKRDLERLRMGGVRALSQRDGLALFDVATVLDRAVVAAARVDVARLSRARSGQPGDPSSAGDPQDLPPAQEPLRPRLIGLDADQQREMILETLLDSIRRLAGGNGTALDPDATFKALGLDSLAAVQLRNELGKLTGVRLSVTAALDFPTPAALAGHIHTRINGDASNGTRPTAAASGV